MAKKRAKAVQHTRRTKSGKVVIVNKGVAKKRPYPDPNKMGLDTFSKKEAKDAFNEFYDSEDFDATLKNVTKALNLDVANDADSKKARAALKEYIHKLWKKQQ